jgi:hypothetical protein
LVQGRVVPQPAAVRPPGPDPGSDLGAVKGMGSDLAAGAGVKGEAGDSNGAGSAAMFEPYFGSTGACQAYAPFAGRSISMPRPSSSLSTSSSWVTALEVAEAVA